MVPSLVEPTSVYIFRRKLELSHPSNLLLLTASSDKGAIISEVAQQLYLEDRVLPPPYGRNNLRLDSYSGVNLKSDTAAVAIMVLTNR